MNHIVASDLEGTLTAAQTWRGMRDYLQAHGRAPLYRRFFWRHLPQVIAYRLGLTRDASTFKEDWILGILALYEGVSRTEFDEMAGWLVDNVLWPSRREEVVKELAVHKAQGNEIIIVSGMFQPILDEIAAKIEAQSMGTPLLFDGDRFTGKIAAPLNVGQRKVTRLQSYLNGRPLLAAYGDTKRDIPMLAMSQNPVAVCPDAELRRAAQERGWRLLS